MILAMVDGLKTMISSFLTSHIGVFASYFGGLARVQSVFKVESGFFR
jgi:hypothetical protein